MSKTASVIKAAREQAHRDLMKSGGAVYLSSSTNGNDLQKSKDSSSEPMSFGNFCMDEFVFRRAPLTKDMRDMVWHCTCGGKVQFFKEDVPGMEYVPVNKMVAIQAGCDSCEYTCGFHLELNLSCHIEVPVKDKLRAIAAEKALVPSMTST